VACPPERVWQTLLNPESLQQVIPGCRMLEETAANHYVARVQMGVGPVKGDFRTEVELSELDPPNALKLTGNTIGALGAGRGEGRLTLEPREGGTRLVYHYQVRVTGKVAAVGGRMLDGAGRVLIRQFIERLARQADGATATRVNWWHKLGRRFGLAR
jgi:2-furoyl-CoA dehydrogenase large subunit